MITTVLSYIAAIAAILTIGGIAILAFTFTMALIYWVDLITERQIIGPPKLERDDET